MSDKLITIFFLIVMSHCGVAQSILHIRHDWNGTNPDFTKAMLQEFKMELIIESQYYELIRLSESEFRLPVLNPEECEGLKNSKYAIVRFSNSNSCFVTHFPNVFCDSVETEHDGLLGFHIKSRRLNAKHDPHAKPRFSKRLQMSFAFDSIRTHYPYLMSCKEYRKRDNSYDF